MDRNPGEGLSVRHARLTQEGLSRVGLVWRMSVAGLWFLAQMPNFEPSCRTAAMAMLVSLWKQCPSPQASPPSWREQVHGKVCDLESLVGQRCPSYPGSQQRACSLWNEGSTSSVPGGPGAHRDSRLEGMDRARPPRKEAGRGVCVQRNSPLLHPRALFRAGELGLPVKGIGC